MSFVDTDTSFNKERWPEDIRQSSPRPLSSQLPTDFINQNGEQSQRISILSSFPALLPHGPPIPYHLQTTLPPATIPTNSHECLLLHVPPEIAAWENDDRQGRKDIDAFGNLGRPSRIDGKKRKRSPLENTTRQSTPKQQQQQQQQQQPSSSKHSSSNRLPLQDRNTPSASQRKPDGTSTIRFWKYVHQACKGKIILKYDESILRTVMRQFALDKIANPQQDPIFLQNWLISLLKAESLVCLPTKEYVRAIEDAIAQGDSTVFRHYADRKAEWIDLRARHGGEVPNTTFMRDNIFELANMWMRDTSNLKSGVKSLGLWDHPNTLDGALPDLGIWTWTPSEGPKLRGQCLFENKPKLSLSDILWLISHVAAEKEGVVLEIDAAGRVNLLRGSTNERAALRDILAQVVEQMHFHGAQFAILGNYTHYLVFKLIDKKTISISRPVLRDPLDVGHEDDWIRILSDIWAPSMVATVYEMMRPHGNVNLMSLIVALPHIAEHLPPSKVIPQTAWLVPVEPSATTSPSNAPRPPVNDKQNNQSAASGTTNSGPSQSQAPNDPTTQSSGGDQDSLRLSNLAPLATSPLSIEVDGYPDTLCTDPHYISASMLRGCKWTQVVGNTAENTSNKISDPPSLISDHSDSDSDQSMLFQFDHEDSRQIRQPSPIVRTHQEHNDDDEMVGVPQIGIGFKKIIHETSDMTTNIAMLKEIAANRPINSTFPIEKSAIRNKTLKLGHYIASGRLSAVFRGTLGKHTPVVAKFTNLATYPNLEKDDMPHYTRQEAENALNTEIAMYQGPLRSLQGVTVPRLYGVWRGEYDLGKVEGSSFPRIVVLWCTILSDCGESRQPADMEEISQIRDLVRSLHSHDIVHRDIRWENTIWGKEKKWWLADFESSVPRNKCDSNQQWLQWINEDFGAVNDIPLQDDDDCY